MPAINNIISNISDLLKKSGMAKAELARRSGMKDPAQLHNILSGRNAPGIEVLERIARALKVSLAELLGEETPSPHPEPSSLERAKLRAIRAISFARESEMLSILAACSQVEKRLPALEEDQSAG